VAGGYVWATLNSISIEVDSADHLSTLQEAPGEENFSSCKDILPEVARKPVYHTARPEALGWALDAVGVSCLY
jgi:hypothetical protein